MVFSSRREGQAAGAVKRSSAQSVPGARIALGTQGRIPFVSKILG